MHTTCNDCTAFEPVAGHASEHADPIAEANPDHAVIIGRVDVELVDFNGDLASITARVTVCRVDSGRRASKLLKRLLHPVRGGLGLFENLFDAMKVQQPNALDFRAEVQVRWIAFQAFAND